MYIASVSSHIREYSEQIYLDFVGNMQNGMSCGKVSLLLKI